MNIMPSRIDTVQLNVSCDLTLNLLDGFNKGVYDIILIKRDPQVIKRGTKVWKEPLVWAASDNHKLEVPLSLVLSPHPCIYRARALAALDKAKKRNGIYPIQVQASQMQR